MKRGVVILVVLAVLSGWLLAQSASPTIYAESFRKGSTQVTEEKFEAKLTPENATYREIIKDSHGGDRYELTITPQGPEGDTKITAWRVQLRDLRHTIYHNLLLENQEPSADPKNNLWWLNPNEVGGVPIRARRIVKVDDFYVTIQVKAMHFTPVESTYFDSMTVQFEFQNSDPRASR